jgi:transcriptional regulator with XRE-family HTH domain
MIAKSIKDLIEDNGGNKKKIAETLGITPQFLGQLESGKRQKPNARVVAKIREVYGVDILTGDKVKQTESNSASIVTIREDVWKEIKTSNDFYREQNTELVSIVKTLILASGKRKK